MFKKNLSPVDQRPDLNYNKYDEKYEVDRTSLVVYKVQNGIPINPMRNTGYFIYQIFNVLYIQPLNYSIFYNSIVEGIIGRGKLFYWGPNYAIQAIFTR